jgi:hypothetical protein
MERSKAYDDLTRSLADAETRFKATDLAHDKVRTLCVMKLQPQAASELLDLKKVLSERTAALQQEQFATKRLTETIDNMKKCVLFFVIMLLIMYRPQFVAGDEVVC